MMANWKGGCVASKYTLTFHLIFLIFHRHLTISGFTNGRAFLFAPANCDQNHIHDELKELKERHHTETQPQAHLATEIGYKVERLQKKNKNNTLMKSRY